MGDVDVVVLQAREMTDRCRGPYIGHRGEERFRAVKKPADREAVLGETPVIKTNSVKFPSSRPTQFSNQSSNFRINED
jgi:hypothetical protein